MIKLAGKQILLSAVPPGLQIAEHHSPASKLAGYFQPVSSETVIGRHSASGIAPDAKIRPGISAGPRERLQTARSLRQAQGKLFDFARRFASESPGSAQDDKSEVFGRRPTALPTAVDRQLPTTNDQPPTTARSFAALRMIARGSHAAERAIKCHSTAQTHTDVAADEPRPLPWPACTRCKFPASLR